MRYFVHVPYALGAGRRRILIKALTATRAEDDHGLKFRHWDLEAMRTNPQLEEGERWVVAALTREDDAKNVAGYRDEIWFPRSLDRQSLRDMLPGIDDNLFDAVHEVAPRRRATRSPWSPRSGRRTAPPSRRRSAGSTSRRTPPVSAIDDFEPEPGTPEHAVLPLLVQASADEAYPRRGSENLLPAAAPRPRRREARRAPAQRGGRAEPDPHAVELSKLGKRVKNLMQTAGLYAFNGGPGNALDAVVGRSASCFDLRDREPLEAYGVFISDGDKHKGFDLCLTQTFLLYSPAAARSAMLQAAGRCTRIRSFGWVEMEDARHSVIPIGFPTVQSAAVATEDLDGRAMLDAMEDAPASGGEPASQDREAKKASSWTTGCCTATSAPPKRWKRSCRSTRLTEVMRTVGGVSCAGSAA